MLGKILIDTGHVVDLKIAYAAKAGTLYDAISACITRADTVISSYTYQSVIDGGTAATNCDGTWTSHYYCTKNETDNDRADYLAAMNMSQAAVDCAIAFLITGDTTYADEVVALLRHWCTTTSTLMEADSFYIGMTNGEKVQLALTLPGFCEAADIIYDYSGWSTYRSTFETWANALGDAFAANRSTEIDNKLVWGLAAEAACGAVSGDQAMIEAAIDQWISELASGGLIETDGTLKIETGRSGEALRYSTYHLSAWALLARIAQMNGRNIIGHAYAGLSMKYVWDTYFPYLIESGYPANWNTFAALNGYQNETDSCVNNTACVEMWRLFFGTNWESIFSSGDAITRPASTNPDSTSKRWPQDYTLQAYKNKSLGIPAGKDIRQAVIRDVCSTSTGNQTFSSGESWTPKAAVFIVNSATADATSTAHLLVGYGVAVSTSARGCFSCIDENGQATTDSARGGETDNCIAISATNPGSTPDGLADLVSFGSGSVTVNWSNPPGSAYKITVILLGGDDLSVDYQNIDPNDTQDGSVTVTPTGYTGSTDVVLLFNPDEIMDGAYDNVWARYSLGVAVLKNGQFQQACNILQSADNKASAEVDYAYSVKYAGGSIANGERFEVAEPGATSYKIYTREASISANELLMVLSLNLGGAEADLHTFFTPTSAGTESFYTRFTPGLVLGGICNARYTDSDRLDQDNAFGVFAYDGTTSATMNWSAEDGADPTVTKSRVNTGIELMDVDGSVIVAATPSFGDASVDLNYTTTAGYNMGWMLVLPDNSPEYPQQVFNGASLSEAFDSPATALAGAMTAGIGSASGSFSATAESYGSFAEGISASSSMTAIAAAIADITESATAAESSGLLATIVADLAESSDLSSIESAIATALAALNEALDAGESWAAEVIALAELIENVNAAGSFSSGGDQTGAISTPVDQSDIHSGQAASLASMSAASQQTEALQALAAAMATFIDGSSHTITNAAQAAALATLLASLNLGDAFTSAVLGANEGAISAGTTNSETFVGAVAAAASLTESESLGDSVFANSSASATIAESVSMGASFSYGEILGYLTAVVTLVCALASDSPTVAAALNSKETTLDPSVSGDITLN